MTTLTNVKTYEKLFRVRTITAFVHLTESDFVSSALEFKIQRCSKFLSTFRSTLTAHGYEVQTVRVATNPFGQYLIQSELESRLEQLDSLLAKHDIQLCALGSAKSPTEITSCPNIIAKSARLSCSATIEANDVLTARAIADCILHISRLTSSSGQNLDGGIGNFRFCAATGSCSTTHIPFFPAATAVGLTNKQGGDTMDPSHSYAFALGLENGPLAYHLLRQCQSIANIPTVFLEGMTAALQPLEELCTSVHANTEDWTYLGIDTSLNPALDHVDDGSNPDDNMKHGSVAAAVETLDEVAVFGGAGTVAAAAAITIALQTLPGITKTGYCGFMLPVCEDLRLAELASSSSANAKPPLRISNLLSISAVCGVGVDTVPLAGDVPAELLSSLLLDVVNLASRWNKPLSCRVFPVPDKDVGERTNFDSPYLCNSDIFSIE